MAVLLYNTLKQVTRSSSSRSNCRSNSCSNSCRNVSSRRISCSSGRCTPL